MPDLPIVDTHVHLWNPSRLSYPWLGSVPAINKPHLLADYDRACGEVCVSRFVFVQCDCDPAQSMQEAEWVTQLARDEPRLAGIVAHAPLEKGEQVRDTLEQLAANPLVKGVRRLIQPEPDPNFCLQPDFIAGVQLLAQFNLSFDICISHTQLPAATRLVEQCPRVRFILDHIAKPDIKNHTLDPWRDQLRELASMPNVHCKLSGLVTEADHANWTAADLKPYIEHVVACFSLTRLTFGSDWPVSTLATDYPRWVHTLDELLAGKGPDDLRKLYCENAKAFYRLDK